MLFMTEYTLKPHMSKAEVKALMDEFRKGGAETGEGSATTSRPTGPVATRSPRAKTLRQRTRGR